MRKRISGKWMEWLLICIYLMLMLAALFFPLRVAVSEKFTSEEQQLSDALLHGEIIRIHILANSDSILDQLIKLRVRDAIIDAFGQQMAYAGTMNSTAAFELLRQNTTAMQRTAQECAARYGFMGSADAETGILELPEKSYGSVLLPAGKYRALRITLGEGKGKNWWCVLYPQLCLALSEEKTGASGSGFTWSSKRIFQHWLLMNY